MSLTHTDTTPAPAFTIARARLVGLTPREAHEAVLGALDAAIIAVSDAAGGADPATIDAKVAELADAHRTLSAHAPYSRPTGEEGIWCFTEGHDGPPWPCPTYRAAAGIIADGLPR